MKSKRLRASTVEWPPGTEETGWEGDCMTDITKIVDFIVEYGTSKTYSGNYHIYFEDICEAFPNLTEEWLKANYQEIVYELDDREEILSETWESFDGNGTWRGFDCNFCGAYCPNWEDEDEEGF